MNDMQLDKQLHLLASAMEYPATPDIAGRVSARLRPTSRPLLFSKAAAWSLTLVLIVLSSLMLIPPARAAILEFIQIGVVRIFRVEPTVIPPTPQQTPFDTPVTATPEPTPQALIPLLESLGGETTLQEAQELTTYPLMLPGYPADLGEPDRVFVQDADGPMTFLIWLDPQNPDRILMSLHFLPPDSWAVKKVEPTMIKETQVNGNYAIWAVGPYPLRYKNGDLEYLRMINGHVLIWQQDDITYRLESNLSMEEAIKIAESLEPIP